MTQKKSKAAQKDGSDNKSGSVFSKAKDALTNTVKALTGAGASDAEEAAAAQAKAAAKESKPKTKTKAAAKTKTKATTKRKAASKAKTKETAKHDTTAKPKSKASAKPKAASKPKSKSESRAKKAKATYENSTPESTQTAPQVEAPTSAPAEDDALPDITMDALSEIVNPDLPVEAPAPDTRGSVSTEDLSAPIAANPPPVLREVPKLQEHVFPTPSAFRAVAMAAKTSKSDLGNLPTEGKDGRFRFQFIYNGMHFIVRVLGKDARGVSLFLEGHLGFLPYTYEGQDLRRQLMEVLQLARKQKMVHINLVAEQRISLTSEILIKGRFNPNTAISAVATRLASVKPLIDVIRSLQPYQREYSDGLSYYVTEGNSSDGKTENAA